MTKEAIAWNKAHSNGRKESAQVVARKARAKKLKFKAGKTEALKELRALKSAVKTAESRLKEKATAVSLHVAKFHATSEDAGLYHHHDDASESMRQNPRLQTNIDFSDVIDAIEEIVTSVQELEK